MATELTRPSRKAVRREAALASPQVVMTDVRRGLFTPLIDGWRYRRLIPRLGARMLAKFTAGTKLGRSWFVIRPLMDTLGKAFIFGAILAAPSSNGVPYFIFLIAGMLGWRLFERSLFFACRSFDLFKKVTREMNFPLVLVPVSAAAFPAVEFVMYVLILTGAFAYYWVSGGTLYLEGGPQLLYAFVGLGMALMWAFSLGLWLSVLNAKAKDVRMTLRYVLDFWLYLTPVLYPLSAVPPSYQALAAANPLTPVVEMVKFGLIGGGEVRPGALALSMGAMLLVMLSGLWFFNREAAKSIEADSVVVDDEEEL